MMHRVTRPMIKGQVFSLHEKQIVLNLISEYGQSLVEENETLSLFRRSKIWREIHTKFNQSEGTSHRTEKQLRLLWKNLKARSKREFRLNAAKYRGPNCYIQDPLLRKMSTLIGVEEDDPKSRSGGSSNNSSKKHARRPLTPHHAARIQQRVGGNHVNMIGNSVPQLQSSSDAVSQMQSGNSYGVVQRKISNPNQQVVLHRPIRKQLSIPTNVSRVNVTSSVPKMVLKKAAGPRFSQDKKRAAEQTAEQSRTRCVDEAEHAGTSSESPQNRRKMAVPRKAPDVIKVEVTDDDDDDDGGETNGDGLVIGERINHNDPGPSHIPELPSTSDHQYPATTSEQQHVHPNHIYTHDQLPTRRPQNNEEQRGHDAVNVGGGEAFSHEQLLALQPPQTEHLGQNRGQDAVGGSEAFNHDQLLAFQPQQPEHFGQNMLGGGEMFNRDQLLAFQPQQPEHRGQDSVGGGGEAFAPPEVNLGSAGGTSGDPQLAFWNNSGGATNLTSEMLRLARKEHDMKVATILMKRKQTMQIKRREHLAKMENYRLNQDILRLKKRKLEMEIRNNMYLTIDEEEETLQS